MICSREEAGWDVVYFAGGGGVSWTDLTGDVGPVTRLVMEAPGGASAGVVDFMGVCRHVEVQSGYLVFVAWDQADPDAVPDVVGWV